MWGFFFLNILKIRLNSVYNVSFSFQNIWKEKLHIDQKYLI